MKLLILLIALMPILYCSCIEITPQKEVFEEPMVDIPLNESEEYYRNKKIQEEIKKDLKRSFSIKYYIATLLGLNKNNKKELEESRKNYDISQ